MKPARSIAALSLLLPACCFAGSAAAVPVGYAVTGTFERPDGEIVPVSGSFDLTAVGFCPVVPDSPCSNSGYAIRDLELTAGAMTVERGVLEPGVTLELSLGGDLELTDDGSLTAWEYALERSLVFETATTDPGFGLVLRRDIRERVLAPYEPVGEGPWHSADLQLPATMDDFPGELHVQYGLVDRDLQAIVPHPDGDVLFAPRIDSVVDESLGIFRLDAVRVPEPATGLLLALGLLVGLRRIR